MKRFDYENALANYQRKYKKSIVYLALFSFLFSVSFALGFIFSTYESKVLMMVIFSIALVVITFVIVTILLFGVLENRKNIKSLSYILNGYLLIVEGKVKEIKGTFTTISGRKGIEIIIQDQYEEISVYFDPIFNELPLKVDDEVSLKICNSFIIEYEVKNG